MAQLLKPQPNRAQWLEERRTYLGASDIAGIVGLDTYNTPYKIYLSKHGLLADDDMSEQAIHGINLEDYVAKLYSKDTGRRVYKSRLYRHLDYPFFGANPDREVGRLRLLECKTCGFYTGKEFGSPGTDEVPLKYLVQCQWQLYVTGRKICDLAVLIAGQDFRIYSVPRDDELIGKLAAKALDFWTTYMESDCPPPLTDSPVDTDLFTQQHPVDDGAVLTSNSELETIAARAEQYYQQLKQYTARLDREKNLLRQAMGDAGTLETSLGKFTWRTNSKGSRVFKMPFNGE